ncbi:DUF1731 domain-containing protein [Pedobacter sp. JY14-1]|uniref:DUF1731 domain-containing protein n=1 Tax=Pedobacter sp. JY14-1 TaxID=3034151 RepID=UPI0023E28E53|nr:DUF1731 domain-containing protein [Pedobacter sp. JY14-1]
MVEEKKEKIILLRAGATNTVFIGTEAELVLSGRSVISTFLQQNGFQFKYPYLHHALDDLLPVTAVPRFPVP